MAEYCTLEEVARELGVTRERARQIQNEALAKLRENLERMGFTHDDLIPEIDHVPRRPMYDRF